MPLTDAECRNVKAIEKPFKLADGKGLYLLVKQAGKYWRWDYRYAGKRQTAALGVYPETDLKTARKRRDDGRALLDSGANPMQVKAERKLAVRQSAATSFKAIALEWHAGKAKPKPGLKGKPDRPASWAKVTADKVMTHLEADVFPVIGARPVAEVSAREMTAMLEKIQARGATYTASRLREICSQVFRFAIATERASNNPAHALVRTIDVPAVRHRPAITDRREFGVFLRALAGYEDADELTLLAMRLALLTFLRSSELRGGMWSEVDTDAREWRIPPSRMKMGKGSHQAHVVPLSSEALAVIEDLRGLTGGGAAMFPSAYGGEGGIMSENTIGRTLIRMGYQGRQSLHGFRASGRSLLSERGWSVAALERQLDHAERSAVVAAYARSEHLEERRKIMDDWGALVTTLEAGGNVVPLAQRDHIAAMRGQEPTPSRTVAQPVQTPVSVDRPKKKQEGKETMAELFSQAVARGSGLGG